MSAPVFVDSEGRASSHLPKVISFSRTLSHHHFHHHLSATRLDDPRHPATVMSLSLLRFTNGIGDSNSIAKVDVEGSNPFSRSKKISESGRLEQMLNRLF